MAASAASSSPEATAPAATASASHVSDAIFSAPIGAARIASGSILVAGLVVPTKAITLTSLDIAGAVEWTADALTGVEWASDARLGVLPLGDGAAIVWTGARNGRPSTYLAIVGPHGELKGDPIESGTAPCATLDTLVWVDPATPAPSGLDASVARPAHAVSSTQRHVRAQAWGTSEVRDLGSLRSDPMPSLVCGDHVVYASVDGDDDRTVRAMLGSADGAAPMVIDDGDFGDDEEHDFQEYSVGDDLGMVRVGSSGEIAIREVSGGKLSGWSRLHHRLASDDVIETVDANAKTIAIVYSNDESNDCPGDAAAKSVHVLSVDRKTHKDAPAVKIAAAECGKDLSLFWIGQPEGSLVVGWGEPGKRHEAPIQGLAFRVLPASANDATHSSVEQVADALVDAGCDKSRCYAVALARGDGADGMAPEPLKLLHYP